MDSDLEGRHSARVEVVQLILQLRYLVDARQEHQDALAGPRGVHHQPEDDLPGLVGQLPPPPPPPPPPPAHRRTASSLYAAP
jgi:hypothetical protein